MTFSDIFKNSFLENTDSVSYADMAIAFVLAFAVGLFIIWVYKKTFRGVLYSKSYATSLLAITMITTMIILTISSNIVLSLGMVGALSIVRFRTAIKEPMDIAFMFWAISAGIVFGGGMIVLGLAGSIVIGVIMLLFVNRTSDARPYMLIVNCNDDAAEQNIYSLLKGTVKDYLLKSKTISPDGQELALQVRIKDGAGEFVRNLNTIPGVCNAVLVSYNGDYLE